MSHGCKAFSLLRVLMWELKVSPALHAEMRESFPLDSLQPIKTTCFYIYVWNTAPETCLGASLFENTMHCNINKIIAFTGG